MPTAEVAPVRAREFYTLASAQEVATRLADESRSDTREEPTHDPSISKRVRQAVAQLGLNAGVTAHVAGVGDGVIHTIALAGTTRRDEWVTIDAWEGRPASVLSKRASLYVSPIDIAGVQVSPADLAGVSAYRSNLDDPELPTFAWVHGEVFVRFGTESAARAGRLHRALGEAGVYRIGAHTLPSRPGQVETTTTSDTGPHDQPGEHPGTPRFVGAWHGTQDRVAGDLELHGDRTWSLTLAGDQPDRASGRWEPTATGARLILEVANGETVDPVSLATIAMRGEKLTYTPVTGEPALLSRRAATTSDAARGAAFLGNWRGEQDGMVANLRIEADGTWRMEIIKGGENVAEGRWEATPEGATLVVVRMDDEPLATPQSAELVTGGGTVIVTGDDGTPVTFERLESTTAQLPTPPAFVGPWLTEEAGTIGHLDIYPEGTFVLQMQRKGAPKVEGSWTVTSDGARLIVLRAGGKPAPRTQHADLRLRDGKIVITLEGGTPSTFTPRTSEEVTQHEARPSPPRGPASIVGTWEFTRDDEANALTVNEDGTWHAYEGDEIESAASGTWRAQGTQFKLTVTSEGDNGESALAWLRGNRLVLRGPAGEELTARRVGR